MRSVERLTVPIMLTKTADRPLHEQLVDALRHAISNGVLPAGSRLPSTRTLAELLGVSRGVAITAYERLHAAGVIHGTGGSGTYVSEGTPQLTAAHVKRLHPADPVDLRPGQACTEGFPLAAWRAAWRQASYGPPPSDPPPGRGLPNLRAAVADHVRRVHGYVPADHRIVITSGQRHALDVLLRAFGTPGPRCAIADPSPRWLRDGIAARGVPAVPVPLDTDGIRIDQVPAGTDVVLVAPDGNVPLGVRTSVSRRVELTEWAERTGGLLVEIGQPATPAARIRPLPSLLALGPPRRTALLGDLGDLLTPALGLGYLVLPDHLADTAAWQIAAAREQPALLSQRAAAELFRTGNVTRRANQLATVHARKLAIVRDLLEPIAGLEVLDSRVPGTATVLRPKAPPVDHLIRYCREAGVLLCPLHEYYARPCAATNGFLLGFAHLDDDALRTALHAVVEGIRQPAGRAHQVA
jgi:GntR family transcriptional regulator / MocR family aminotransferase